MFKMIWCFIYVGDVNSKGENDNQLQKCWYIYFFFKLHLPAFVMGFSVVWHTPSASSLCLEGHLGYVLSSPAQPEVQSPRYCIKYNNINVEPPSSLTLHIYNHGVFDLKGGEEHLRPVFIVEIGDTVGKFRN